MDNQHQKIKGYRELNQDEIDLMNEIKEHGEATKQLLLKIAKVHSEAVEQNALTIEQEYNDLAPFVESARCINLAQDHLQTGQMWLTRAIALPDSF